MILNLNKKKLITICTIAIFLLAFFIRVFYISQKAGIHIDEGYTHVISTFNEYQIKKPFEKGRVYTGKELKNLIFENNTNLKEALQDVIKLRKNNNNDTSHSTLYHSVYLLWMQGESPISMQNFIYKGCGLNLLFFIFSFFMMYKILQKLFPDNYIIIVGLAFAYLNTGSISNTLLMRPYQLQELAFVVLTYVFIDTFQKLKSNENIISVKNSLIIAFSIAFTALTGFFALVYILLLGSILLFLCLKNKHYKNFLFLSGCAALGFILVFAFYPGYLNGLTSVRGNDVKANITNIFSEYAIYNFIHSTIFYINIINSYLIYTPLIFLLILAVYRKQDKYNSLAVLLIFVSIIYSAIVMYIAPYKVLRYIVPVFPVISLIFTTAIAGARDYAKNILFIMSILLLIIYSLFPYSAVEYTIACPYHYFRSKIENVNDTEYEEFKFIQKPELPVIIVNNPEYSCCLNLIFNMPDNQKYEFIDSTDKIPDKYDHYFLLFERKYSNSKIENINLPKNYVIADRFNPARFEGYELIRK